MDKSLIKLNLLRWTASRRGIPYLHVLIDGHKIGSIGGFLRLQDVWRFERSNNLGRYLQQKDPQEMYWQQKSFEVTPGKHTICVVTRLRWSRSQIVHFELPLNGCIEFRCGTPLFLPMRLNNIQGVSILLGLSLFVIIGLVRSSLIPQVILFYLLPIIILAMLGLTVAWAIETRKPGSVVFIEQTTLNFNDKLRDFY